MNILILGAGAMGSYLASALSKEEHHVILADQEINRLDRTAKTMDVATVYCAASNWPLIQDLQGTSPDFFIAMTGSDEANLASCHMAKNLGYKTTICRITERSYLDRSTLDFSRLFSVDRFIAAEVLCAEAMVSRLLAPTDKLQKSFHNGAVQMKSFLIPKNWKQQDIPLKKLSLPEEMVIGLILRKKQTATGEEKIFIFPHGDDVLLPEDEVVVIAARNHMPLIQEFFFLPLLRLKHVMIIGGSSVGMHVAKLLEEIGAKVKIVEIEEKRCEVLANIFPEATILHHDGSDASFLLEEKLAQTDACITAMQSDEKNLLVASIAKKAGAKNVLSTVYDPSRKDVFQELGIHYALSGPVLAANQILSIIHGNTVRSISSIFDDEARVVEMKVSKDSVLIGVPIADLKAYLPNDLLICVIESKGALMIGKGDRILSPGDNVILLTTPRSIHELEHLF